MKYIEVWPNYNQSRPDNVLSKHPVDHDDHGAHQLESSAEEEEVGTSAGHDDDGEAVLRTAEAKQPASNIECIMEEEINTIADLRGTQTTTRRQAMRKRTREGQSCMFSLKICLNQKKYRVSQEMRTLEA